MDNLYTKMLDSDNFSLRQRTAQEHQKKVENLYFKFPKLKEMDLEIAALQKEYANQLALRLKGQKNIDLTILNDRLNSTVQSKVKFLKENNIPENYKEPRWSCTKCEDRGKNYTHSGVIPCTCQVDTTIQLRRKQAGLSLKIQNATFKTTDFNKYQPEDRKNAITVYKMIHSYLQQLVSTMKKGQAFQEGIFLHGETGSGKTHLLGCIANYLIESNLDVSYIVYADLLDRIRETYNDDNTETESSILRRVNTVSVLLIDDLGMEKNSEFAQKYLGQIIDHRYRNMLPTIITSNFTLSELKERSKNDMYGERVIWRCVETSKLFHLAGNLRNSV